MLMNRTEKSGFLSESVLVSFQVESCSNKMVNVLIFEKNL